MQMDLRPQNTNHNTGLLKVIAIVSMIFDHSAVVFSGGLWMRCVGRLAFPLFAWCVAVGAEHTRSMPRYALRLFLVGLIAQPFFMLALNHGWNKPNVFCTLLLGLIAIWGMKDKQYWMTVIAVLLGQLLGADYAVRGVLCILMLWLLMDKPFWLAVCFGVFCAIWGSNTATVWQTPYFSVRLQNLAILALPLMLYPMHGNLKTPKWLMYAVYPGHLAVLWLLDKVIKL